jgi:hypothetical protein
VPACPLVSSRHRSLRLMRGDVSDQVRIARELSIGSVQVAGSTIAARAISAGQAPKRGHACRAAPASTAFERLGDLVRQWVVEILRHTQIFRPECRGGAFVGGRRAARGTIGLPDLAIMISSPVAAASTRRDNCVFAA